MSHIEGQDTAYWNERFESGHWANAGGNYQSVVFMDRIIKALEIHAPEIVEYYSALDLSQPGKVGYRPTQILDYGCAEGDGTAVLQARFPMASVVGIDWSRAAVERAGKRWPTLSFRCGNAEQPQPANLIFTSHTIEHTTDPASVVNGLLALCDWLVVAVPPITATDDGGHTGAVPLSDWLPKTPEPHLTLTTETIRYAEDMGLVEGTVIIVYRGSPIDSATRFLEEGMSA